MLADAYTVTDRLYGRINLDSEEKELVGNLHYLHGLSLSSVPNGLVPISQLDTRLHHSIGANHLVKKAIQNTHAFSEFSRELRFAALLHDAGHPCFSHLSEPFLEMLCGMTHETYILERLERRGISKVLKRLAVDLQLMYRLINGLQPPFSDLLHGSMDVDNLDNVPRYLVSSGINSNAEPFEDLASAFSVEENILVLRQRTNSLWIRVYEWLDQRRQAYRFIHSEHNISPGAMLHRAMEFAYGHDLLKPSFFDLSDEQALSYLEKRCGQQARYLVQQAMQLNIYTQAFALATENPNWELFTATTSNSDRFEYRHSLANTLSAGLNISPADIAVYAGMDRGIRTVNIPILREDGSYDSIGQPASNPIWHLQVFIHPSLSEHTPEIQGMMREEIVEDF